MKTSGLSSVLSMLAVATSFTGQIASASEAHHRLMLPSAQAQKPKPSEPLQISWDCKLTSRRPIQRWAPTQTAAISGRCLGRGNNTDCAIVGNPPVPLPRGGIVMGRPAFTWALQNNDIIGFGLGNGTGCDALTNGTVGQPSEGVLYRPCGQIVTTYEDDTGDSSDDLLQRIVVTQGNKIIFDSGIVDFGPAGPINYPVSVILDTDANFGYWPGAQNGPNNGNCTGNINYPLRAPRHFPQPDIRLPRTAPASNRWPGRPPSLPTPRSQRPSTSASPETPCTSKGVASPCFTVKFSRRYLIHQNWQIFLE